MQNTHCMPYRNDQSIVSIVSPRTASACVHGMPHASMLSALIGLSTMYIVFADCITPHCSGSNGAPSFGPCVRSDEHTSELQSLMRISYGVICLKITIYSTTTISLSNARDVC